MRARQGAALIAWVNEAAAYKRQTTGISALLGVVSGLGHSSSRSPESDPLTSEQLVRGGRRQADVSSSATTGHRVDEGMGRPTATHTK
jgi:hypothetical protein